MTLIKCPSCSHTVSSVASKCPACGYQLTQPRFQQGHEGALTECRKCGRKVLSKVRLCPYCGIHRPGRRSAVPVALGIAAVAVPILMVLALQQQMGPEPPPVMSPLPDVAPLSPAPPPAGPGEREAPATPAAPVPSPAAAAPPRPVATQTHWISEWANVREGRSVTSRVLGVLRPGQQVEVADRVGGWWAVYLEERFVGYVAASVLLSERPGALIPR